MDTANLAGELDHKHINIDKEDDTELYDKRLIIKLPIFVMMRGEKVKIVLKDIHEFVKIMRVRGTKPKVALAPNSLFDALYASGGAARGSFRSFTKPSKIPIHVFIPVLDLANNLNRLIRKV